MTERFWSYVDRTGDCWIWQGQTDRGGYGLFRIGPRKILVHRISFELSNGPIPDEMFVCHRCDNPPCVRPNHLFLGGMAQLNEAQILEIRRVFDGRRGALTRLSREFGTTPENIKCIVARKTWRHLP